MKEKKYTAYDIQSLENNEHVRLRPELYFEDCFKEHNLNSLALGAMCHAVDEYFDSNCTEINLTVDKKKFMSVKLKSLNEKLPRLNIKLYSLR